MLKFASFSSDIELPFYTSLASHKINHDKLDDSARKVLGLYEVRPGDAPGASCRMQVHGNALTSDEVVAGYYRAEGMIKNVNTVEEYRNLDKTVVLNRAGRTIWDAIKDGTIYSCPSLLSSFSVLCFADLKRYKFTYLFGFPALHSDPPWKPASIGTARNTPKAPHGSTGETTTQLTGYETTALVDCVQTWRYGVDARQHGFFLAKRMRVGPRMETKQLGSNPEGNDEDSEARPRPVTPGTPGQDLGFVWAVSSLASYEGGFFNDIEPEDRFVCFADPSTYLDHPGWMLRNLLVLIQQRWGLEQARILCYRDVQSRRDEARSIILDLSTENSEPSTAGHEREAPKPSDMPKVTGWERNRTGKVTSKIANLGEYMDPRRLADQAVDLNLKLIKWRIAPTLDLEKIKNTRCLLLGAGTLGSYVARNLLGWGVRKITFVDNATVSFSNPVRQPLYDFKDCLEGGAMKAYRASEALSEIYPGVESSGHVISVPMAGHPIIDENKAKAEFDTLQKLVDDHDVIFLLMDTRESRWLPTVMGKSAGKLVMNAALGFDTFVVMRHGVKLEQERDQELGCYFCNDVVAPADSVRDRTLDQQCTVTRPGIAAIASALLVEVFVSVLQHPACAAAPAPSPQTEDRGDHPLGIVPHQIRGFLSSFQNMVIRGRSYDCCSACSDKVVHTYRQHAWSFVKRALNERGYVEELSGLAEVGTPATLKILTSQKADVVGQVQRAAEKAETEIDWEEESEMGDPEEGELI